MASVYLAPLTIPQTMGQELKDPCALTLVSCATQNNISALQALDGAEAYQNPGLSAMIAWLKIDISVKKEYSNAMAAIPQPYAPIKPGPLNDKELEELRKFLFEGNGILIEGEEAKQRHLPSLVEANHTVYNDLMKELGHKLTAKNGKELEIGKHQIELSIADFAYKSFQSNPCILWQKE